MTVPYLENGPALAYFFDKRPKATSAEPGNGLAGNKSKRVHLGEQHKTASSLSSHASTALSQM